CCYARRARRRPPSARPVASVLQRQGGRQGRRPAHRRRGRLARAHRQSTTDYRCLLYTLVHSAPRARIVTKSLAAAVERVHSPSPSATAAVSSEAAVRELMAVREIVQAFLTADRPEEVFRFALERVSPLVGATFASVYLIDGASELMRLAAAYNWPSRYEPWLGEMRVRLGFGPSGEAASERRAIEVPDVFADPHLEDWQEVASELGFRALIALPLQTNNRLLGAVTFYFSDAKGI